VNTAIDYLELGLEEQEKYDPRFDVLQTRANSLVRYIVAGKDEVAFQFAREIENLGPPFDIMIQWAYLDIYLELEDPEGIEEYLEIIEDYSRERQIEISRAYLSWARGKIHEARGEYETAINYYLKSIEQYPVSMGWKFHIGRCYRMNKQYRKAEENFKIITDWHPFWPEELYEFGLLYAEWGKHDKAVEYLNRALDIWENADSTYKPAKLARQKLNELEAGLI
jgi:tetratricopeptide (TPR) repeat protein